MDINPGSAMVRTPILISSKTKVLMSSGGRKLMRNRAGSLSNPGKTDGLIRPYLTGAFSLHPLDPNLIQASFIQLFLDRISRVLSFILGSDQGLKSSDPDARTMPNVDNGSFMYEYQSF